MEHQKKAGTGFSKKSRKKLAKSPTKKLVAGIYYNVAQKYNTARVTFVRARVWLIARSPIRASFRWVKGVRAQHMIDPKPHDLRRKM